VGTITGTGTGNRDRTGTGTGTGTLVCRRFTPKISTSIINQSVWRLPVYACEEGFGLDTAVDGAGAPVSRQAGYLH
jgi:hypothetical protein